MKKQPKSTKHAGGRPSEMTPEKVKKLEEVFAIDGTIEEACFYAGITKTTYYNWLGKNPELVDRFNSLREKPILLARQRVVKGISESYTNAMDYLKRKKKLEFSERQEMTGADGAPLMVQISEVIAKKNAIMKSDTPSDTEYRSS